MKLGRKIGLYLIGFICLATQVQAQEKDNRKEVVNQFYNSFDTGKTMHLHQILSQQLVDHDASHPESSHYEGIVHLITMVNDGLTNVKHDLEQVHLIGENMVVVRWNMTAKHTGSFLGMSSTGKSIAFNGHDIFKFKDGRIVEMWHVEELLGFIEQLSDKK